MESNLNFKYLDSIYNLKKNNDAKLKQKQEENSALKNIFSISLSSSSNKNDFKKERIKQLISYKNFLILLTEFTTENYIIVQNSSNESLMSKEKKERILKIKTNLNRTIPLLYTLQERIIEVHSLSELLTVKAYEFNYSISDFSLFEYYNNFNLEIILANDVYEIIYYNKGIIMDNTKVLTKEKEKISSILYNEPFLIWVVGFTVKVFDLEKKILLFRRNYETDLAELEEVKREEIENKTKIMPEIKFFHKEKYITIIVNKKILNIIKIVEYNDLNFASKKFFFEEMFYLNKEYYILTASLKKVRTKNEGKYSIIGSWMNIGKDKIFIIKKHHENFVYDIDVFSMKEKINSYSYNIYLGGQGQIEFPNEVKFEFDVSSFNIFIYDSFDIHSLILMDSKSKLIYELKKLNEKIKDNTEYEKYFKENSIWLKNSLDVITDIQNFDERKFLFLSVLFHLNQFLKKSNAKKIERLIDLYFTQALADKTEKVSCDIAVDFLIKTNKLEFCFNYINRFLDFLSDFYKEKVIVYFVSIKNFEYLETFINILKKMDLQIDEVEYFVQEKKETETNIPVNLSKIKQETPYSLINSYSNAHFSKIIQMYNVEVSYILNKQTSTTSHKYETSFIQFLKVNIKNLQNEEKLKLLNCYIYLCSITLNFFESIKYSIIYGKIESEKEKENDRKIEIESNSTANDELSLSKNIIKRIYNILVMKSLENKIFDNQFSPFLFYNLSVQQIFSLLSLNINKNVSESNFPTPTKTAILILIMKKNLMTLKKRQVNQAIYYGLRIISILKEMKKSRKFIIKFH